MSRAFTFCGETRQASVKVVVTMSLGLDSMASRTWRFKYQSNAISQAVADAQLSYVFFSSLA